MRSYAAIHGKYEVGLIRRHFHACKVRRGGLIIPSPQGYAQEAQRSQRIGNEAYEWFFSVTKHTNMCVVTKA